MEFLSALLNYSFLQNAVLAAALASIACGITGTYVVVKRISYIGGGISHAVLGGMGAAYFFGVDPMLGAIAAALLAAAIIGWVRLRAYQHEDTLIGVMWAVGMAIGIIFITKTPGYSVDLTSFLFGNILMVSSGDVVLLAILDLAIVLIAAVLFRQFLAVIFDEEFARLRGLPVDAVYFILLGLIALTVVALIQVVGLVMVIALLTLPASIAALYTRRLSHMMVLAALFGWIFSIGGLAISYEFDLPSGATIVLLAGIGYVLSLVGTRLYTKVMRTRKTQAATSV